MHMDTLVLTCMDPRLNEYLDREYCSGEKYGKVEIWRDASGRFPESGQLIDYIEKSNIKTIILSPHTDCKAKKYMYEALKNNATESSKDEIIEQARLLASGKPFTSREEFDNIIDTAELSYLKDKLRGRSIYIELDVIDVSLIKLQAHVEGEHYLIISTRTDRSASEIAREAGIALPLAYIIQGPGLDALNPDINLALGLGMKKVSVLTAQVK
jgi:carbonic anhydrase